METITLKSWACFEPLIQRLSVQRLELETSTGRHFHDLLFRGVGDAKWNLETTLERSYPKERSDETMSFRAYYRKVSASKRALATLMGQRWDRLPDYAEFDELMRTRVVYWLDFFLNQNRTISEYLIHLRHHGFPSPLLDWTASPYIAAFFAFDDVHAEAENVSLYVLMRDTSTSGSNDEHFFVIGRNVESHTRHFLQQSSYSLSVAMDADDYRFVSHSTAIKTGVGLSGRVIKLNIPASDRLTALKHLDSMNINPFSLFGSEDSLIRTIARRECLFRSWDA